MIDDDDDDGVFNDYQYSDHESDDEIASIDILFQRIIQTCVNLLSILWITDDRGIKRKKERKKERYWGY